MKEGNKTYWMVGIVVAIVIVAPIIFVNVVSANNGNGNGNGNNNSSNSTNMTNFTNSSTNIISNSSVNITSNLSVNATVNITNSSNESLDIGNGNGNGNNKKDVDMKEFKILKSDGNEFSDEPEVNIEENGDVNFLVKINMSMCNISSMEDVYILVPEINTSNFLITSKRYPGLGDCKYREYYDSFKFNFLEKRLYAGNYSLYKNINGQPLFMLKIKIKGTLPSAAPVGTVMTEEDKGIIHDILVTLSEILKYIKINWMGQNETIQPSLAVETVKWVRVGEEWNVYAKYTDQHGKPILGACNLNTEDWGIIRMNYEEKLYVAKHVAEPVGKMRWTVICQ